MIEFTTWVDRLSCQASLFFFSILFVSPFWGYFFPFFPSAGGLINIPRLSPEKKEKRNLHFVHRARDTWT